ncbi:MAG: hypothetical protein U1F55_08830 [Chitinivorax sp.]
MARPSGQTATIAANPHPDLIWRLSDYFVQQYLRACAIMTNANICLNRTIFNGMKMLQEIQQFTIQLTLRENKYMSSQSANCFAALLLSGAAGTAAAAALPACFAEVEIDFSSFSVQIFDSGTQMIHQANAGRTVTPKRILPPIVSATSSLVKAKMDWIPNTLYQRQQAGTYRIE